MDEKSFLLGDPASPANEQGTLGTTRNTRQTTSPYRLILSLLLATFVIVIFFIDDDWELTDASDHISPDASEFDWQKVTPSTNLEYTPCYDKFFCTRLEVSLDWNSTKLNGAKAALAIIKRPAEVDVTHPSYGGAILFNPGGPGGSGIQFMNIYGEPLARILNVDLEVMGPDGYANASRFYDLISWDPRAVGNTTPLIDGFLDPIQAQEFDKRFIELSGSLQYQEVFNRIYDIQGMFGQMISAPQPGFSDDEQPARFSGTTSVIRDMVEIIEKHGEWRERAAEKILAYRRDQGGYLTATEKETIRQRTAYHKDHEKLQYWGFSYGTIVGQTFATMYPERVGRLAIDGVVNASDYYAGDWKTELIDSERITKNFTRECEAAGPHRCAFAQLTQNTGESLLDAFERTISGIENVPITGLVHDRPVYITDFVVTSELFTLFYTGFIGYNIGADLLSNAANRNVSFFHRQIPSISCKDQPKPFIDPRVSQPIILCSDSENKLNETREEHWEYIQFLRNQSKHYGKALARVTLPCHTIDQRPKWRFAGPFGAQTANPILILSQTLDPVTPLISAQGAAALFPGSQVVEAQGIGHCSLGYPSICANKEVKKYFYTGAVPKEYTRCPAALRPFRSLTEAVSITNELPAEDRLILAAALKIANHFPLDNDALKYRQVGDVLPGAERGVWWSDERQVSDSVALQQELVDVQYVL